jgi:hypothetical protein
MLKNSDRIKQTTNEVFGRKIFDINAALFRINFLFERQ